MKYRLPLALCFAVFLSICAWPIHAKDTWTRVQSKNFVLVGNASEKEIRRVGEKLEQFRESFRILFAGVQINAPIGTNVVVFKSDSSYRPFKPKRSDGKTNDHIAGYFQPGEDVNYITLTTEGGDKDTFGTIFHEYVHSIINSSFGRSEVPQWFNEGIAEYYQTFEIVDNIKVKIGLPQGGHLQLLQQQSKLLPLDQLLKVTNYQLHESGDHSRNVFYAQSWALVHYLIASGKSDALGAYLMAVTNGKDEKEAFETSFQTTYTKMESNLRGYVSKSTYKYNEVTLSKKLDFNTSMQASPVSEALSNAYLGDLLYHANRPDDAEPYLATALSLDPESSMANTALGMVKTRQRKFNDARPLFEKAMRSDPANFLPFYQYAYLLSREARDEFGFVRRFEPAAAAKMRDALRKAIEKNPAFGESYELYGFISLVNEEELDEAVRYMSAALKHHPGNQRYLIRLGELYTRQKKFPQARLIAVKLTASGENDEVKSRAGALATQIDEIERFERLKAEAGKQSSSSANPTGGAVRLTKRVEHLPEPSAEDMAKLQQIARLQSMNEALRPLGAGEIRTIGRFEKVDCKKRPITYSVKAGSESLLLSSKDFSGITLSSLDEGAMNAQVGCDAKLDAYNAIITYKAALDLKAAIRGELVAVEFVPADFRFLSSEEATALTQVTFDMPDGRRSASPTAGPVSEADMEAKRREMILDSIKSALQVPGQGEKRVFGHLEMVECRGSNAFFVVKSDAGPLRLKVLPTAQPRIVYFAPDLNGVAIGCGQKAIEFPAYFIYSDKPDPKAKTAGDIRGVDFLPKSFVP